MPWAPYLPWLPRRIAPVAPATSKPQDARIDGISLFTADTYGSNPCHPAKLFLCPQYNRYLRRLAAEQRLAPAAKARLYAEINMAAADGGIACFDGKYTYGFWRPVTAIPAADTDDNPATVADLGWLPSVLTPNHPEYPSAHACVSGAIANTLDAFFGSDAVTSTIDSAVTQTAATFARFSDLYQDVHEARILGGLHYRFSMNAGRRIGRDVSRQLTRHYFTPVRPEDRDEADNRERDER